MNLLLASGSTIRAQLLANAGLSFRVKTAPVDEADIKSRNMDLSVEMLAGELARQKALAVSHLEPKALVIAADQILAFDNSRFDKPASIADARRQLTALRGKPHQLISAVCCASGDNLIWSHVSRATLEMRDFSDAFLDDYVSAQGDDLLSTVGGYKLEGRGVQLFERIEGDYFTILGLPLFPLLDFLRTQGVLPS